MIPKILPEATEDTFITLTEIGTLEEETWGQVSTVQAEMPPSCKDRHVK